MSVFSNRSIDPPQERARYAGAILDLLGDKDPIAVLRETPAAVARAVEGLAPAQLRRPEAPGKWSIVQVLQHYADGVRIGARVGLELICRRDPRGKRIRPVRQRDAPQRGRASAVSLQGLVECGARRHELERVQQRHGAREGRLRGGAA